MDFKNLKQNLFQHTRYSYGPHSSFEEFFLWARRRVIALKMEDLRNLFGKSRLSFGICRQIELLLLRFGYTFDLDFLPADQDVTVVIGPIQDINENETPDSPRPSENEGSQNVTADQTEPSQPESQVDARSRTDLQLAALVGVVLNFFTQLLCAHWSSSRRKPRPSVRKLCRSTRYRVPIRLAKSSR